MYNHNIYIKENRRLKFEKGNLIHLFPKGEYFEIIKIDMIFEYYELENKKRVYFRDEPWWAKKA